MFVGALVAFAWPARAEDDARYRRLSVLARALHYIETTYQEDVDPDALVYGAIHGMVARLDRFSAFIEPEDADRLRAVADRGRVGIGLEVAADGTVISMLPGSPAARALIRVGDVVRTIDGVPLSRIEAGGVAARFAGEPGTLVRLGFARGELVVEKLVARSAGVLPTVEARRLGETRGYLSIRRFEEGTPEEVRLALDGLGEIDGLIMDLRDNPGGVLGAAVRCADYWLAKGRIVSTVGRGGRSESHDAHEKGTEPPYPMIVLINGRTASAAEVLAGALQDHGRARLVGTQSFGKGTVQTVIELEDRSALRLSVSRYLTPSGRAIEGVGLRPDRLVAPELSGDRQLAEAENQLLYRP